MGAICIGLVLLGIVSITDAYTVLVSNILPPLQILIVEGILGITMLICISVAVSKLSKLSNVLEYYGRNSMVIMGIHSELHLSMRYILERIGLAT